MNNTQTLVTIMFKRLRFVALLLIPILALLATAGCEYGLNGNSRTIKVATWNIEHLREEDGAGFRKRTPEDFQVLTKYAASLNADVIAVQEVESEAALGRVFNSDRYAFFVSKQTNLRGNPIRTGFVVDKRFKVWRNGEFGYLDIGQQGRHRSGIDITVDIDGTHLRLLSVHLKSGCFDVLDNEDEHSCDVLFKQAEWVEAWIDKRAIENEPFIVLGDFNRRFGTSGETIWDGLDDANPTNADLTRATQGKHQMCHGGNKWPDFIDHIVLGKQVSRWLVPNSFLEYVYDEETNVSNKLPSDHCAQSIELQVDGP